LVTVDAESKTFRYTHDYYLLKHLTHFVEVGAKSVEVTGTGDDSLAFVNPDNTVVVLVRNSLAHAQMVQLQVRDKSFAIELAPDSVNTVTVN
jgi:glucosylceramidase